MRTSILAYPFVGILAAGLLAASLKAADDPKNHRYGVVTNHNSYPVEVRILGAAGDSWQVAGLKSGGSLVVPVGSTAVEVYPSLSSHPIDTTERLNVQVSQAGTDERHPVPGFGDRVSFRSSTGGFVPADYESKSAPSLLAGSYFEEDRGEVGLRLITSSDPATRIQGMEDLGAAKDVRGVDELMRHRLDQAYTALGQIGGDKATSHLAEALTYEEGLLRDKVAEALGRTGTDEAHQMLHDALVNPDAGVRAAVVKGLGVMARTEDIPFLLDEALSSNAGDHQVHRAAVAAIHKIGGQAAIDALDTIVRTVDDPNNVAGLEAQRYLARTDRDRSVEANLQNLSVQDKEEIRARAAQKLGYLGSGPEVVKALQAALEDSSPSVREAAAYSLGQLKSVESVELLEKMLQDSDLGPRASAAYALGEMGDPRAIPALKAAMNDQVPIVAQGAATALGKIGGDEARALLKHVIDSGNPNLGEAPGKALAMLEERAADARDAARSEKLASQNPRLLELNETLQKNRERLAQIDEQSEEAKLIRRQVAEEEDELSALIERERDKDGAAWVEKYRADDGTLPGGMVEDARSRLVKLERERETQAARVAEAQKRFDEARSKAKPVEPWEERLKQAQNAYREAFVRDHGAPSEWSDEERTAFMNGFNAVDSQERTRWEKETKEEAANNHELGKRMNELVHETGVLADLHQEIAAVTDQAKAERQVATENGEDTGDTASSRANAAGWPGYDLPAFTNRLEASLGGKDYTYDTALAEVEAMLREVDFERARHDQIFQSPRFMACYYLKRGRLPPQELGVVIGKVDPATGQLNDTFADWMSNDMARATDMAVRPVVPGLSSNDGHLRHIGEMNQKLTRSLEYLKSRSQQYEQKPPVREMAQLRKLMSAWRALVAGYHNDLDAYFAFASQFLVTERYYIGAINDRRRKEIHDATPNRDADDQQAQRYHAELKALVDQLAPVEAQMEKLWAAYPKFQEAVDGWADKTLPPDLVELFGPTETLLKANQEYLTLEAGLKQLDENDVDSQQVRQRLAELKSQIAELMKTEEQEHGEDWKDAYRSSDGSLPGGFLTSGPLETAKARQRIAAQTAEADLPPSIITDKFYEFLKGCR